MTKALEAAADAMWANMADSGVKVSPRLDPVIAAIRAFAANVTEEMIDAFFDAEIPAMTGDIATTRAKEGIRAAIERGLV